MKTNPVEMAELVVKTYDMSENYLKDFIEDEMYEVEYGKHLNKYKLESALEYPKWDLETTTAVAKEHGIVMDKFNEYDWSYILNKMYCLFESEKHETADYVKYAKSFLDQGDNIAYNYYKMLKSNPCKED